MASRPKPCDNCRRNHSKCDDSTPKCSRCQKSGRDCIRREATRHFYNSSTSVTIKSPEKGAAVFQYIDETPKFTGTHTEQISQSATGEAQDGDPRATSSTIFSSARENGYHPSSLSLSVVDQQSPSSRLSPIRLPQSWGESQRIPTPQVNLGEAFLLRYFVEELAKWFDLCDPERHFGLVVPQRARTCAPLLNAILSASARHFTTLLKGRQKEMTVKFSLEQDLIISEEAVLDYHNRCIAHLRFLASEPDAIMDENLLAAVVILRFYEELDNPFAFDSPTDAAVRGLQVFIEAQATQALSSKGLRSAAFWVGFRQEFHMAFSQQRSFHLPLGICESYLSGDVAPDHVLVNRLIVICAHIVQYCYDEQAQRSSIRYEELVNLYHQWLKNRPASFLPIYSADPKKEKGGIFPRRWYLNDCHIVAEQSIGLINILLTAYDPTIVRVGPEQRGAVASLDSRLRSIVLEVCGIALSNRQSPTALLAACIAITICGDRFSDPTEQKALMDIVIHTIRDNNYWPPTSTEAKLKRIWGWH
ncbi:hypothetical protein N7499_000939 [Penicillium canescens]|uniref:Zn(2)-C6 fungal-type domain-containing protein n=1 Tax=Penicillium canescens TaxID=5083 RepID=A0AAD6I1U9_PENCN|nr:uncharacterized protein N7446_004019 [Penicillium canescens]KAJ6009107.1 hypothetical protein N7522_004123 [Penicillium canescens]KAJ6027384.1 hypothetical protein N7460_012201 [Penicillium canescens]KAJ6040666.1 hypothetical protein N7444_009571 [Penicillium canescens]KAJ6066982.1 hypothetical protein N7446_004019 [Penicillium canescens]KAJ6101309.1 hypothetical protein N7499_000939 [Penicillium canescens]